ncbi:MAG: IclR family transcriptional regulator C-terminal domain-containing protein, partial [Casimicrobiaceae bacterium]
MPVKRSAAAAAAPATATSPTAAEPPPPSTMVAPRAKPAAAPSTTPTAAEEIQALSGDPNFMTSLARGLAVIRGFSQQRRKMSIAQLSLRTGIPRAAVRRCLYTLGKLGYVGSEDGRMFALRPQILSLGHAYLSSVPLVMAAQPILDQVSESIHESCSLAILDGDEILYVARSSASTRIMSIDLGVGSRLPAHCTSMGRVLLAGMGEPELATFLRRVKLAPFTNRTIVAKDALADTVERVRKQQYAVVDQELEIGLRSIAVPVKDFRDRISAAINVSVQAPRVTVAEM